MTSKRVLKAEWWEIWWVKPGEEPVMRRAYGKAIPWWIPDGVWVTKESALKEVNIEKSRGRLKYLKIFHVKRYTMAQVDRAAKKTKPTVIKTVGRPNKKHTNRRKVEKKVTRRARRRLGHEAVKETT